MKAVFYTPYLDSLGGGERYVLSLIEALNSLGWETFLLWDGESVTERVVSKFGIDISKTKYLENIFKEKLSWLNLKSCRERFNFLGKFDLVFYLSDGSLPWLFGRKNVIHLQVPFQGVDGQSLLSRVKKKKVDSFVVNSEFTKRVVDGEYGIDSVVVYPPVDVESFKPLEKENVILYSARFSNLLQQKGHMVAIQSFKELYDSGLKAYWLWLVGSSEIGADGGLLEQLRKEAEGYPIKFFLDVSFKELQSLYGRAQLFWSAVGYDVDEKSEPERCEHFGISVVEAMSAGCVPLVVNKGGYKEIVIHGRNGFLWNSVDGLLSRTTELIGNSGLVKKLSLLTQERAKDFSKEVFVERFLEIINS